MAEVSVVWRGDQVLAEISSAVLGAMTAAGQALAAGVVSSISAPYPPASSPGQPPHRRSGGLRAEVTSRTTRAAGAVTMTVGVPSDSPVRTQAQALQGGTARMAARPFVPTVERATAVVLDHVAAAVRAAR